MVKHRVSRIHTHNHTVSRIRTITYLVAYTQTDAHNHILSICWPLHAFSETNYLHI